MALRIIVVFAIVVAAILIVAAMKPKTFRIERSVVIQAPPEKIFPLINDFHNWSQWSPQDKEDPTLTRTYGGAANGAGAESEWSSKGIAGSGRASITESVPPRRIVIEVDFVKPFAAHNVNEFTLEPDGASTKVTWKMQGTNRYFMKVMSVFANMDRMMGRHFESGLRNLKGGAEGSSMATSS